MNIPCKLCEKKRARRHCPGVEGEICPQCCGAERENSIACPATCEYLIEARFHEQPPAIPDDKIPNQDIRIGEQFLREREPLVFTLALALKRGMAGSDAVDFDAREALDGLIRRYRAMQAGLIYDTRPSNTFAAAIQENLDGAVDELRKGLAKEGGKFTVADSDVLGVLVFLQRLELQYNNERRRGKAFRDFLTGYLPEPAAESAAESQAAIS